MIVDLPILKTECPSVGIAGTGFVARQFALELCRRQQAQRTLKLSGYLTRRNPADCADLPCSHLATGDIARLIDGSDIIFECTGDPLRALEVVDAAMQAGKPVLTLNPEFHVTLGSAFVERGYLSEADGDQPGCLASLHEEAVAMGFEPLVYGNMKGFLNRNPSPGEMRFWGDKQGISLPMVTSFTDGTKVQIEQVLVGNGLGADIAKEELLGLEGDELKPMAAELANRASLMGTRITDYVLSRSLPHGVFVTGRHDSAQSAALDYIKMGSGPFYTLIRPNILVHLEPFKTIERLQLGKPPLLNNSARPRLSVAAVAKRDLMPGERISRGCGSFEMRGIAVRMCERAGHLPIGLAVGVHVRRRIEEGQVIELGDVDLEPHRAIEVWHDIERKALDAG